MAIFQYHMNSEDIQAEIDLPAGTGTVTFLRNIVCPLPLHSVQGVLIRILVP